MNLPLYNTNSLAAGILTLCIVHVPCSGVMLLELLEGTEVRREWSRVQLVAFGVVDLVVLFPFFWVFSMIFFIV
jgi:hypothetical protein